MDVLSEMLRAVKLEGSLFFNAEFSAPWCVGSPRSSALASLLPATAEHLIIYHFVTEGRAYARLHNGPCEELAAGDIVMLPHGDPHVIGNGPASQPVDTMQAFGAALDGALRVTRFGGGGEITRFVCGYMACEPRLSQVFLAGLPAIMKLRLAQEPAGEWLANSIRFSAGQGVKAEAGRDLVLAKLSELLFIETLRLYISALPAEQVGWFAGARDPVVGRALAHLHREPSRGWTVANLARSAGVSRSRLAERFQHLIGEPPMTYLARWRLNLSAEMLDRSDAMVAEVAAAVGYGSEAAFNRAFKRQFGLPPAKFRRKREAARAQRA